MRESRRERAAVPKNYCISHLSVRYAKHKTFWCAFIILDRLLEWCEVLGIGFLNCILNNFLAQFTTILKSENQYIFAKICTFWKSFPIFVVFFLDKIFRKLNVLALFLCKCAALLLRQEHLLSTPYMLLDIMKNGKNNSNNSSWVQVK